MSFSSIFNGNSARSSFSAIDDDHIILSRSRTSGLDYPCAVTC